MGKNGVARLCVVGLYATVWLLQCGGSRTRVEKHFTTSNTKLPRKTHLFNQKLDTYMLLDSSNNGPFVSPPFSMAPYDSLPPTSLPENAPPYCDFPPPAQQQPSTTPAPMGTSPPPPEPMYPGPTLIPPSSPNPPTDVPTPTQPAISPPSSDPTLPSPPTTVPTPTQPVIGPPISEPKPPPSGSIPSPRFLPPVVYPPPMVPPPPNRAPSTTTLWCVAKASVPEPIIQEAMNYACGSGADCDGIQPNGPCFQPNTLFAHASYAFNSYWQRTKLTAGGTCDFGGTAVLVTVDPSYDGCHFVYF